MVILCNISFYLDTAPELDDNEMVRMVDTVDFHIHRDFMQNIFDSCKDITMQGGISVLKTAMCGQWGPHCNPERLFKYIGSGPPKACVKQAILIF